MFPADALSDHFVDKLQPRVWRRSEHVANWQAIISNRKVLCDNMREAEQRQMMCTQRRVGDEQVCAAKVNAEREQMRYPPRTLHLAALFVDPKTMPRWND